MLKKCLSLLTLLFVSMATNAKVIWSDYSVTYLNGSNYEVGDADREVLTFEHAAGTSWGDSFMFFDRLESDNGDVETYGEFAPRVRFSEARFGIFKNFYFAPSIEMGPKTNYLWGVSTDIDIEAFAFFKLSAFFKDNGAGGNNEQVTLSWGLPLGPLFYDGFMDYATSVNGGKSQMNLTSQLKYDIAPHFNLENKFYVGFEYVFWNNKFGIDGVDERNLNLLVKYHY